jgi:hypothetical protein
MTAAAATPAAAELRMHLDLLLAERALIRLEGLDNAAYEADLSEEILAMSSAYVGAAVTEIASLRAQLSGPLVG